MYFGKLPLMLLNGRLNGGQTVLNRKISLFWELISFLMQRLSDFLPDAVLPIKVLTYL